MFNLNKSCMKKSQSPTLQIHSERGEPNGIISYSSVTEITECSHCKLMPSYGIKRYNSVRRVTIITTYHRGKIQALAVLPLRGYWGRQEVNFISNIG